MSASTDTSMKEPTQRLPKWYCYMCCLDLYTDEEALLHNHRDEGSRQVLKLTNEIIDFNEAHDDKQSVIYQDDE